MGKGKDVSIRPHVHNGRTNELIYVDYGRINLRIKRENIVVSPGECIFLDGKTEHSFHGLDESPFDFLNIMFEGKLPESIFGKVIPVNRKCFELAAKMKEESMEGMPYGPEVIASFLTAFIAYLIRQVNVSIPSTLKENANYKKYRSEFVNRALKAIVDEYQKPLNMETLSKAVGIGESRLRQLIRQETGENFTTHLHRQRVNVAKHLLGEANHSLQEIANTVGYRYPSFFFRIFKRITGMTPVAYSISLGEPSEKK